MKTLILATALIAVSGFGGIAAAQTTADVSTTTQQATSTTDVALGNKQVPAVGSRNCIRDTGSHIKRHDQACLPVNGSSYSQEDLQRTGNPDVGRALQQLDPRIQVSHGH